MIGLAERYNLRDLGGCRAGDGRRMRLGAVFRSASLVDMAPEDVARLLALGIALVIDLRSGVERARSPASHAIATWVGSREESSADLEAAWRQPGLSRDRAVALMTDVYRRLPEELADAYGEVFRRIAEGTLPVLFHCAAGKDRTGVCAALLLDLLGVPRGTIAQDYLATRRTVARAVKETRASMQRLGIEIADDTVLEPILNVDAAYLDAMFASIEERYGSSTRYIEERLGIGPAQADSIRQLLLEPR